MIFGIKIFRLDFLFLLYQDKRKNVILIKNSNHNNLSSTGPYIFMIKNHGKNFSAGSRE
jgi:hypothetical protein